VMVSPCLNYVYVSCMDGIIYKYDIHNAVQRSVSFTFYPDIWTCVYHSKSTFIFQTCERIFRCADPQFFHQVQSFSLWTIPSQRQQG
jgi:hypothetical protein